MNHFDVTYENGIITIVSNTTWRAKVEGNVILSSYEGNGSKNITVSVPDNILYGSGTVYFSYGNKYCKIHPSVYVYLENSNYFKVTPNFVYLNGKGSTAYVTVSSLSGFTLSNITDNDKFTAIPFGNNKILFISKTDDVFGHSGETYTQAIDDVNTNNNQLVYVYQGVSGSTSESDNDCLLTGSYSKVDDTTLLVNVTSINNGANCDFTWDYIRGVTITKVNVNTISLKINDDTINKFTLHLYNECNTTDGFELPIDLSDVNNSYVFDIAAECGGVDLSAGKQSLQISILAKKLTDDDDSISLIQSNQEFSGICNANNCNNS